MITNTFSLLYGIGEKSEQRLWSEGILTWTDFVGADGVSFLSRQRKALYDKTLRSASEELLKGNSRYFSTALRRSEHWRLFPAFGQDAVCLDIETNGFAPGRGGKITVVGLYDGHDYKCLIRGRDLTEEALNREFSRYKYLITFSGSVFDIPFLSSSMKGFLTCDIPHFDLCSGARRLGLKGGLKKLEPRFGIKRHEAVCGLDGYDAVLLWQKAKKGSKEALDRLILYNREDTVNLFRMAGDIYKDLKAHTGIEKYAGALVESSHGK